MGGFTVKIEGDRDGLVEYLEERAADERTQAKAASAKEVRAMHNGIAQGLDMAARYVRNWTDTGPDPAASLADARPPLEGYPADGRVHDDGPGPHPQYMT